MPIQSIRRKKAIRGKTPDVDNRKYREEWPELRLNMRKQISVTGEIRIAIVDSGNPSSNGEDRDDDGHATLLDRMIRSRAESCLHNGNINIRHVKAFNAQGWPGPKRCAAAIKEAAIDEPGVIVLAWDVGHTTGDLRDAIGGAHGSVVVIAAGNWSLDNDRHPNWPANYGGPKGMEHLGDPTGMEHVITVMATDEEDERASFSSYGASSVDIAAPGFAKVDVPKSESTLRRFGSLQDSYSKFRGTSAATAHVALLAALVRAKHGYDPTQTKSHICNEFRDVPELREKRISIGRLKKLCVTAGVADFDEALKVTTAGVRYTR